MTPDERRDRWTEARVAASAYRALAAAQGVTWEEAFRWGNRACCEESRTAYLAGCACSWAHFDVPPLSHFLSPADEGCAYHVIAPGDRL